MRYEIFNDNHQWEQTNQKTFEYYLKEFGDRVGLENGQIIDKGYQVKPEYVFDVYNPQGFLVAKKEYAK